MSDLELVIEGEGDSSAYQEIFARLLSQPATAQIPAPRIESQAEPSGSKVGEVITLLEYSHLLLEGVTAVMAVLAVYLQTRPKYKLTMETDKAKLEIETSNLSDAQIQVRNELTKSGAHRVRFIVGKKPA